MPALGSSDGPPDHGRRAISNHSQKLPDSLSSTGSARRSRHPWADRRSKWEQLRQARRSARQCPQASPRPGWSRGAHSVPQRWQWRVMGEHYPCLRPVEAGSCDGAPGLNQNKGCPAHSSACGSICFAITYLPTESFRLSPVAGPLAWAPLLTGRLGQPEDAVGRAKVHLRDLGQGVRPMPGHEVTGDLLHAFGCTLGKLHAV